MRTFRFRLEAVLTLREQVERAAQQRYGQAVAAAEAAAVQKRSVEAEIAAADEFRAGRLTRGLPATELEQMRGYRQALDQRLAERNRELEDARQRAEEARRVLVAATRQREALERLRDHQRRLYDYEAARADQKVLDEMSRRGPTLATAWQGEGQRN